MRALFICTYGDFAATFEKNNIRILQDMGYEIHVASNFADASKNRNIHVLEEMHVSLHHINFERSPFSVQGIKNIRELNKLIKEYHFDEIDCHNPVCGILGRLCGKKNHVPNIIYTAHGFHFYKGAPLKNWLLYFPAEWICSWMTDVLITINQEDYKCANRYFHAKKTEYVPGVGIDLEKFAYCHVDKNTKCEELKIPNDKFLLLSVGELQERKNQRIVIEALGKMQNENIYYLIAGQGVLEEEYEQLIKSYGLQEHIRLLGYRTDIDELCEIADCFIHPAFHEGLPVALLEAMAGRLPIIASDARGIRGLVVNKKGGLYINPQSVEDVQNAIHKMYSDNNFRRKCSIYNFEAVKKYSRENIDKIMHTEYSKHLFGGGVKHILPLIETASKRSELGISNSDFVLISVGELNENKNHQIVINAIAKLCDARIKYIICGQGVLEEHLKEIIKQYELGEQILLLGYRNDIKELLSLSDLFVFPSKREGLSVALMEAMACGLPVICENIRGNNDLIEEEKGGFLITKSSIDEYADAIRKVMDINGEKELMGKFNQDKIKQFSIYQVNRLMKHIYGCI